MPSHTSIPVSEIVALQRDVERLVSRFNAPSAEEGLQYKPPIDVFLTEGEIVVRLEVPGLRAEDIQVTVTGGVLTLSGRRQRDVGAPAGAYVVRESTWGSFERQVSLPEGIDPSRVRAAYHDGLLEVRLPNLSGVSRREVPITREPTAGVTTAGAPASAGGGTSAEGTPVQPSSAPHLFHGAEEMPEEATSGGSVPVDQAEPADEGIYTPPPAGSAAAEREYAGGHVPSQEEWLGRTSSEEESLEEVAEEERAGGGEQGQPTPEWPTRGEAAP